MTKLTNQQTESIKKQAKELMTNLSEKASARDVMAQLYVDNLDDKTIEQGHVMADAILDSVKAFDNDYSEAQKDIDKYLKRMQGKIDEGKTLVERCTYWLRFTATLTAACMMNDEVDTDSELTAEQINAMYVSESEATPEYEQELHEKACETIKNSGILLSGVLEHAAAIQEMDSSTDAASLILDFGTEEIDYRAIMSMLVYTNVKNGTFDNIPADTTINQITTLVCAEVEQAKIMEAVGSGHIAADLAESLLDILGGVVICLTIASVTSFLASAMIPVLGGILVIPAIIVAVVLATKAMSAVWDVWSKTVPKIVKATFSVVKTVAKGAATIVKFLYDHVIKKAVDGIKNVFTYVISKFNMTTDQTVEETDIALA